jgi:hypothetical protein
VSEALKRRALSISPAGVRCVWQRHDLTSIKQLPIWMTEDQAAAMMVTQIPRLSLVCLRELRLELDAWQSLLRDGSRREGDEHAASAAETSPTRPLRAQRPTGADSSVRAEEAVAAGERAPGGDASDHR